MHHAHIDKFAYQDSSVHRLDSRVKFLITILFTAAVISLPRTSVSIVFCYAVGPFAVLVIGKVPLRFVFKHILLVSPFVLVLALTCPLYDRTEMTVAFGPWSWQTTAGWMRAFSIFAKFTVTMMALIALVSTTRFPLLLAGLQKIGVPQVLVIQLGFLYRYIFLVVDRAQRLARARATRKLRYLGLPAELKVAAAMLGSLFIRSIDSAERVDLAMRARGFTGTWRTLVTLRICPGDLLFALVSACFIIGLYLFARPLLP